VHCEARWLCSVCSSVCISNCASCDCCSSTRSAASAPRAASRISSSGCESDARIALSTWAHVRPLGGTGKRAAAHKIPVSGDSDGSEVLEAQQRSFEAAPARRRA
jgi:hypothetical protein